MDVAQRSAATQLIYYSPGYYIYFTNNLALTTLSDMHLIPCTFPLADCAVCTEGYAPGPSRRCHECSVENMGYTVGFCITVLLLVLFVVVLVVSHLLQMVGGEARQAPGQPQPWWRGKMSRFRSFLVKSIPLSAIRIVVVVLQIVIQVSFFGDSLT